MGDTKVTDKAIQAPSMGALVAKIIENENAVGYASYGVAKQNEGKIFALKLTASQLHRKRLLTARTRFSVLYLSSVAVNLQRFKKPLWTTCVPMRDKS